MANSVDPDQMLHSAASDLGLQFAQAVCPIIFRVITVVYFCLPLFNENEGEKYNSVYCKYCYKQAWAISVNPDQMPQNATSDEDLHFLLLIQGF